MTREQAEALIEQVASYLGNEQAKYIPVDNDNDEWVPDPQHHDDAAVWARRLLHASGREAHCGCPLCRG